MMRFTSISSTIRMVSLPLYSLSFTGYGLISSNTLHSPFSSSPWFPKTTATFTVFLYIPYHLIPENAIILPLPYIKPHRKALRKAASHAAGRRALKSLSSRYISCCIKSQCCYYGIRPANLRPNSLHFESASSSGFSWAITPCPPTTAAPASATRSSQSRIHCPSPQP